MAHFAEINQAFTVVRVLVVPDSQQERGQDFLANDLKLGGTWLQTSYNTTSNKHRLGGVAFRKNYAAIGYTYSTELDAFIPPKPGDDYILNTDICQWELPSL